MRCWKKESEVALQIVRNGEIKGSHPGLKHSENLRDGDRHTWQHHNKTTA